MLNTVLEMKARVRQEGVRQTVLRGLDLSDLLYLGKTQTPKFPEFTKIFPPS